MVNVLSNQETVATISLGGLGELEVSFDLPTIKAAASGIDLLVVKSDGSLWGIGSNRLNQLGIGVSAPTWTLVTQNVSDIKMGERHSVMLKTDGSVWTCGSNNYGQLGIPGAVDVTYARWTFVKGGAKSIATSALATFIIDDSNVLYAAGKSGEGQFGFVQYSVDTFTPIKSNVKKVYASRLATMVLLTDSSVIVSGQNSSGKFGLGTTSNVTTWRTTLLTGIKDIAMGASHCLALKYDGAVIGSGFNDYYGSSTANSASPTWNTVAQGVTAIAAAAEGSLMSKSGILYWVGNNRYGLLGGDTDRTVSEWRFSEHSNVADMIMTDGASLLIKSDGSVWYSGHDYDQAIYPAAGGTVFQWVQVK